MRRAIVLGISLVLCFTFLSRAEPRVAATEPVVDPFTLLPSGGAASASSDSPAAIASTLWTRYAGNPVLGLGASGAWDATSVGLASVLYRDGLYRMWYTGGAADPSSGRIGLATSPDGVQWTKSAGNPVLLAGAPGAWDSGYVFAPHVIYHDGMYKMWYRGTDAPTTSLGARIGYATSPDGVTWQKYAGNPVLNVGDLDAWDERLIASSYVIVEGSTYKMWYSACGAVNCRIGYATSPDGINWTKYQGNPVLGVGSSGSWDSESVLYPNVLFNGSSYEMWYTGRYISTYAIGYATSPDGIQWKKYPSNPVLAAGAPGSWESAYVLASPVLLEGKTYKMWYTGNNASNNRIGFATSPLLDRQVYLPQIRR